MGCVGQGYSEYIAAEDRGRWLIELGDYEQLAEKIYDYYVNRWEQKLIQPIDIDELIKGYLKKLEK